MAGRGYVSRSVAGPPFGPGRFVRRYGGFETSIRFLITVAPLFCPLRWSRRAIGTSGTAVTSSGGSGSASPDPAPQTTKSGPASGSRPAIVCIVGHHKSGGTPLGAILGSHPDLFYGGEMYRFPVLMWEPGDPNRLCSCGQSALSCPFWSQVRSKSAALGLLQPLRKGQRRFERWGSAPRTLYRLWRKDPAVRKHAEVMETFAGVISSEASAQVIIDQCPNALRARLYRVLEREGVSVRYLHLVRDGRGFLYSELNAKPGTVPRWQRLPFVVVARWVAMNLLTMLLCSRDSRRYLRIRYEDLVSNPDRTLRAVGSFLGYDFSGAIAKVQAGEAIPMRHVAAANRARLEGSILLRADARWQTSLSQKFRRLFWLMAGWLARSYGYQRRVADSP